LTTRLDSLGDELIIFHPAFDDHNGLVDIVGIRFEEMTKQLEVGKRVFDAVERCRVEQVGSGVNSGSAGSVLLRPSRI
jgi:hypothetical protein